MTIRCYLPIVADIVEGLERDSTVAQLRRLDLLADDALERTLLLSPGSVLGFQDKIKGT